MQGTCPSPILPPLAHLAHPVGITAKWGVEIGDAPWEVSGGSEIRVKG